MHRSRCPVNFAFAAPPTRDAAGWLTDHLHDHYRLYGELSGVRSARKHIGWALRELPGGEAFRAEMNRIDDCRAQLNAVSTAWDGRLRRIKRLAEALQNNEKEKE